MSILDHPYFNLQSNTMAQETKLKRKDLKEPDQFLVASNTFLDFLTRNRSVLVILLVGILAIGGGFLFMTEQKSSETLKMESLYFQMTQLVEDEKEPAGEPLITKLNSLLAQFEEGDQKTRAILLLGDAQYQNKLYDDAIASFKMILDKTQPGTLNGYMVQSGMAHSYEGKKDFNNAITHYKNIIDHPGESPLFYVYLGLARCYELSQDSKNALLILREMQTKFPEHAGLEKVNLSLKRLEG
jgi:tetratricopeptide (TPR) repeat protein